MIDGPAIYDAILKAIRGAKDTINFETCILEDDKVGRRFAELLLKKQAEGVQVNLLYDSVGCISTPSAFFQRLRDGGIQVLEFNPINPSKMHGTGDFLDVVQTFNVCRWLSLRNAAHLKVRTT